MKLLLAIVSAMFRIFKPIRREYDFSFVHVVVQDDADQHKAYT